MFPIIRWQRGECGLGYSKDHIDTFKGVDCASSYNVTRYNKAAIKFLEKSDNFAYFLNSKKSSKFLLTQDLLSGEYFFNYTAHYLDLCRKVDNLIRGKYNDKLTPRYKTGDKYMVRLFTCLIIAFVDRFGFEELSENICDFFYRYVYTLRLVKQSVYLESINKYALGNQDENNGLNLFEKISHMRSPDEIYGITLESIVLRNVVVGKEEGKGYDEIIKEMGIKE